MKVTTTITNKELTYIHEYVEFWYDRESPCRLCPPYDRSSCDECEAKKKYDEELEQFKEKWCTMDHNIVLDPTVKEYMDALKRVHNAAKALDQATLEMSFAKSQAEAALAKLTIDDTADTNEAADRYYSETPYTEEE